MGLQKLSSTDAFLVVDLDDADRSDGLVRCARKVLQDGARTLARSRTYSWALLGERVSGASAGISATTGDREGAVAAFVAEVSDVVATGAVALDAGKGVHQDELERLTSLDGRAELHTRLAADLLGISVSATASVVLGDLTGASVVVEGAGPATAAVSDALAAAGAEVVSSGDGAEVAMVAADLLVCGSKPGLIDHDLAGRIPHRAIVACGPAPVTARGLAVAGRRGIVVMADFLTLAGPLLSFRPSAGATPASLRDEVDGTIRRLSESVLTHPDGPYLGAALLAEDFLRSWRDELPFGRPLP